MASLREEEAVPLPTPKRRSAASQFAVLTGV